jgi:predicted nuclease of restriction endonuclease-like RecB superfamily
MQQLGLLRSSQWLYVADIVNQKAVASSSWDNSKSKMNDQIAAIKIEDIDNYLSYLPPS